MGAGVRLKFPRQDVIQRRRLRARSAVLSATRAILSSLGIVGPETVQHPLLIDVSTRLDHHVGTPFWGHDAQATTPG
jgi:hypothetical protein